MLWLICLLSCRTDEKTNIEDTDIIEDPDFDGDGYPASVDCDDFSSQINPGALEICDGSDNNCDLSIDEGVTTVFYLDADGDGFGDPEQSIDACEAPENFVLIGNDCDDTSSLAYPAATEFCDTIDNDCDGDVDEDVATLYYFDLDEDGYGDPDVSEYGCETPDMFVENNEDCDDTDSQVYPEATERCDEKDNDCDGEIDEDIPVVWFLDADGDGFGSNDHQTAECNPVEGYLADSGDCNDLNPDVSPEAQEICDDIDNDCDALTDDADDSLDLSTIHLWYLDADGDGFGSETVVSASCTSQNNGVLDNTDCDDSMGEIYPGSEELCDGLDNDCDTLVDDDDPDVVDALTWYADSDSDGYGDDNTATVACLGPSQFISIGGDCLDSDADINPSSRETCDGVDEDCDGSIDNGTLGTESTCPGEDCRAILMDGSNAGDGLYWIDPDLDGNNIYEAYCDMTTDGGGWTKMFSALYPHMFDLGNWEAFGSPEYDDFSKLQDTQDFADSNGVYTIRLQLGELGNWDTNTPEHHTIWQQSHHPFLESSDGSDYVFMTGSESVSCGGFSGLHNRIAMEVGLFALTADADNTDSMNCWWLQIIPINQYGSTIDFPGYVDSYDSSGNVHQWQSIWFR